MRTTLFFVGLIYLIPMALAAQDVHPECPQFYEGKTGKKELASAWFNRGRDLAEASDFQQALGAYTCSYRFVAHPNTLFNMGQTALKSGNDPLARELFETYVAENPDGTFAKIARERIVEIKNRQAADAPVQEEHVSNWRVVDEDGNETPIATAQEADQGPPDPVAQPAPMPEAPSDRPGLSNKTKRILGWSGIALGAAAVISGVGLQFGAVSAVDSAEQAKSKVDLDNYNDKAAGLQTGATVLYIVGGVAAAGGTLLLLLTPGDDPEQVAWVVYPGGVSLTGRF